MLRVLLEPRAHTVSSIALYREPLSRIVHLRSFDIVAGGGGGGGRGGRGHLQTLREDLPVDVQLYKCSLINEYVWHDHLMCSHRFCGGDDGGDRSFECVAVLNSEWLNVPAESIRFAEPPGDRIVQLLAVPRFFLYTTAAARPCQYCPWHVWAHAHKHVLRQVAAAAAGDDDALYHEVCFNGFYTCGLYRVHLCEEWSSGKLPLSPAERRNGHCSLLIFERRTLTALVWLRDPLRRVCRRYKYSMLQLEQGYDSQALILRAQKTDDPGTYMATDKAVATLTIRHTNPSVLVNIRENLRWLLSFDDRRRQQPNDEEEEEANDADDAVGASGGGGSNGAWRSYDGCTSEQYRC